MLTDAKKYTRSCPEYVIATGVGRRCKPELHPIPVQKPFQVLGIDMMDLPLTERGNRHVVVILDLFSKWPLVFPVPDQKAASRVSSRGGGRGEASPPNDPTSPPKRSAFHITETESL